MANASKKDWQETTLGDVATVDWGNTDLTKRAYDQTGAYLAVSAAGCDGRIAHAEHPVGTTVISAIGEYAGRVFYPREPFTAIKNTLTVKAKNALADDDYLHYLLVKNAIPRRGAAQPFLSKGDTMAYPIVLPSLEEQRSIAAVLSSLDDKIELLRRQNETLEQIAQAVFNEWFGKPTTDTALPEGWRNGALNDIAVVDWGNTNLTKAAYVPIGEYLGVSAAGCDGRMSHAEHQVGTTVLSAIGEYAGRTFYPTEPFTAIKNTITVSPKSEVSKGWFIHHLLTANAIPRRGAAQPFLSKGDTEAYSVAIPPVGGIERANALFCGFEEKQKSNTALIKTLTSVRNALLPRLMNGDVIIN